jgi:lysophospholipase
MRFNGDFATFYLYIYKLERKLFLGIIWAAFGTSSKKRPNHATGVTHRMTTDFKEPAGLNWGHFQNAAGADIRYASIKAPGESKGTVLIVTGFRESIEKFFEVAQEMLDRGLDVYMMDWRGQGGSERYIAGSDRAHHEGYEEQIDTLHQMTQTIVKKDGKPLILMGQSMGGHIGMRYLKEHEGVFDSAIITAPMIDIVTGSLPVSLARQVAKFAKAGGYLDKYTPGGGDWDGSKTPFAGNDKTSDQGRYERWMTFCQHNPQIRIGDPTYGWLYETFKSIDILNDENYLRAIKTPILMQSSGNENIVSKAAIDRAVQFLPDCRRKHIEDARHEIWRESDHLRNDWLKTVDGFLAERLDPPGAEPKKPSAQFMLRRPRK